MVINCYYFYPPAKQRSPYALNTSGDGLEDQDGDSRYFLWSSFNITGFLN